MIAERRARFWWLAIVVVAGGSAAAAEPLTMHSGLANMLRQQQVQFLISAGRVTVTSQHFGSTSTGSNQGADRRERLLVTHSNRSLRPSVNYSLVTAEVELSIDLNDGDDLTIRRVPLGASDVVPLEFRQEPRDLLSLKVGSGPLAQSFRAASLWHLLIAEPELCGEQLLPLLEMLRPGWPLAEEARELENELCQSADLRQAPDYEYWASLVRQLGSDDFGQRQSADRTLRRAGQMVLPYLQRLDRTLLDAEQQFRVRRIIRSLSVAQGADTPPSVVPWLAADPQVWFSLLDHPDADRRQIAADQLRRLLDEPFEFDPEADPEVRARQIEGLRHHLGPIQPLPVADGGA